MTTRPNLPAGVADAVQEPHVNHFPMIYGGFDAEDGGPVYICGWREDVTYDGHLWISGTARGILSIEPISEAPDEIPAMRFTLTVASTASVAEALVAKYKNRPLRILWAFFDPVTGALVVDDYAWAGRMSAPVLQYGRGTQTLSITGEHRLADWMRSRRLLYNHADQQRIDPTDNYYLGSEGFANKEITVFSKAALIRASRQ